MANFWEPYRRWFYFHLEEPVLPTVEQLDAFQQTTGFRLPDAYRDYALCFGLGEFQSPLGIYIVIPKPTTKWLFPGQNGREEYIEARNEAREAARGGDEAAARYARLIFFAAYGNGGLYAWDPADITDPVTGDARIYRVDFDADIEDPYEDRLEDFGVSFTEFMLEHVFAGHFRGIDPAVETPTPTATEAGIQPRFFLPSRR